MPFPKSYGTNNDVNLYGFRKLIDDISRPYLYMLEMPNIDVNAIKMTAFAASTSMPGMKLKTEEFSFQTAKVKVANGMTFNSWNVEFICDRMYSLRNKFIAWMSQAYDPHRAAVGHPHSYKFDGVKVHQLSRTGEKIQTYQFIGLFPESISDIKMGHDMTDYTKFTVDFAYDHFTVESGNIYEEAIQIASGEPPASLAGNPLFAWLYSEPGNINEKTGKLFIPEI
jgi:hypothetical protein